VLWFFWAHGWVHGCWLVLISHLSGLRNLASQLISHLASLVGYPGCCGCYLMFWLVGQSGPLSWFLLAGCLAILTKSAWLGEHPWTKSRHWASFIFASEPVTSMENENDLIHSLLPAVVLAVGRSTEMRVCGAPVELSSAFLSELCS
jgi:hypothetical protein